MSDPDAKTITDTQIRELRAAAQRRMSLGKGGGYEGEIERESFIALDRRYGNARRQLARERCAAAWVELGGGSDAHGPADPEDRLAAMLRMAGGEDAQNAVRLAYQLGQEVGRDRCYEKLHKLVGEFGAEQGVALLEEAVYGGKDAIS